MCSSLIAWSLANRSAGKLRDDILGEKVNRCSMEVRVPLEQAPVILQNLREVARGIDTVFSIDLISVVSEDGSVPSSTAAEEAGMELSMNGKTNVGLGRPLVKFS